MKVNVNDLKKLVIPDTTSWKVNPTVLENIMEEMEIPGNSKVIIDFKNLNPFILDNLDSDSSVIFVIPTGLAVHGTNPCTTIFKQMLWNCLSSMICFWIVKAMLLAI